MRDRDYEFYYTQDGSIGLYSYADDDVYHSKFGALTEAWEKFVITRENLNFYNDELLANSKELLNASLVGLSKKEIDLTTFLVSKKTYFDLILEYQQALADYYVSYAELVKEMNIIEIEKEFI